MSAAVKSLLGSGNVKRLQLDVLLYEYDSVRCRACVFVCGVSLNVVGGGGEQL